MALAVPAWDLELFRLLNGEWRHPVLDVLAVAASSYALLWGLAGLALLLLLARAAARERWRVLAVFAILALSVAATDLSTNVFKTAVGRVRPLNALAGCVFREDGEWRRRPPDFVCSREPGSSFPSGHAANSMASAAVLLLLFRRARPWVLVVPLAVGWSRVYLGKHYPLDVAAGWLWGLLAGGLACIALAALARKTGLLKEKRASGGQGGAAPLEP